MSLDVYFRKDIANALEGIYIAGEGQNTLLFAQVDKIVTDPVQRQELAGQMETYRQGYQDALLAVALAFGIVEGGSNEKMRRLRQKGCAIVPATRDKTKG